MKTSKSDLILNHLLDGKGITQRIAIDLYQHYRLASVINRLRNRGFNIETTMIITDTASYARYKLIEL